ncbi:MAG: hypothetical protein EKK34_22060 [Mycobacterium sp.]|nr:MAG: hypothetical protein EKK34_22060 [Mycobacterium sp.]
MDDFDEAEWFDEDGNPRDGVEFGEFVNIVANMMTEQPDQKAAEEFLRGILPRLRAAGKHAYAQSLIADYVQMHGKPLEFDG